MYCILDKTQTVASLLLLLVTPTVFAQSGQEPKSVVERFVELDTNGGQLTAEGRKQVAMLFTSPEKAPFGKAVVVKDIVISPASLTANSASAYVEYTNVGELDVTLATFSQLQIQQRSNFVLKRSDNNQGTASSWHIEGTPPEPHIKVGPAIRYLQDVQKNSTDDRVRRNAATSIVALTQLQTR